MNNNSLYRIAWLGYNKKPNYNRIWGWLEMNDGRKYVFFGVKNKKIEFKLHIYTYMIPALIKRMEKKGYRKIKVEQYEEICPEFIEKLENWLISAILEDNFV